MAVLARKVEPARDASQPQAILGGRRRTCQNGVVHERRQKILPAVGQGVDASLRFLHSGREEPEVVSGNTGLKEGRGAGHAAEPTEKVDGIHPSSRPR